jgi:hypothetical protein
MFSYSYKKVGVGAAGTDRANPWHRLLGDRHAIQSPAALML